MAAGKADAREDGIFHNKKNTRNSEGQETAKENVFYPGILPVKNTGLHPPDGGSG
ncbi:MAG: hypothetical protein GX811_06990 [Lentisphaerae bacterium]|nr:hypothetical protein [Lentisphaerota bacterium]